MASATTGAAPAAAIQARRRMSISSGLGPASADTSSGSSAMPQIGQAPGPSWRTSASMGQTNIVPGGTGGSARGAGDRYFSGSAANFVRQPAEQKWWAVPAWSAWCCVVAGSTVIPQTGSFAFGDRYLPGSASNLARQPAQQK